MGRSFEDMIAEESGALCGDGGDADEVIDVCSMIQRIGDATVRAILAQRLYNGRCWNGLGRVRRFAELSC